MNEPARPACYRCLTENQREVTACCCVSYEGTNMAIDLYYTPGSAPCRIVMLVAAALNIELNLYLVNFEEGEHLKPDFLKLNPQHTVPTIVDDGFSLWESRAIARYLVNKYGGNTTLYPKDPQARAVVDQRLDFDIGTLYPRFTQYSYPQLFGGAPANEAELKKLEESLVFFNTFLEGSKYAAGEELTLADLSLVASVSTIDAAGVSLKDYPNVEKWFELVKASAPDYEGVNNVEVAQMLVHKQIDDLYLYLNSTVDVLEDPQ